MQIRLSQIHIRESVSMPLKRATLPLLDSDARVIRHALTSMDCQQRASCKPTNVYDPMLATTWQHGSPAAIVQRGAGKGAVVQDLRPRPQLGGWAPALEKRHQRYG
eukprot:601201-Amphidinium_carterae.1